MPTELIHNGVIHSAEDDLASPPPQTQDISAAEIKQITEKYSNIITKNNGEIVQTQNWGLLNLAYMIKKNKKGNSFNLSFL